MTGRETVAVIGAGNVGSALAAAWAVAGRPVLLGARGPASSSAIALGARLGITPLPIASAIDGAAVVVLAVPGAAVGEVIDANSAGLAGKVVIDATNDLRRGHASAGLGSLPVLARQVSTAAGYRAFNSVGWENIEHPRFGTTVADLLYAGPDTGHRGLVEALIADVGFRPIYVGDGADAHQAVDSLATLWFALAFGQGRGRRLALRLLTADDDHSADDDHHAD